MEPEAAQGAVLLRYRGREITASDLQEIHLAIETFGGRGRIGILRALCESWQWRQPNGKLKICACRDLLLRLQDRSLVELPASKWSRRGKVLSPLADHPLPVYPVPIDEGDLSTLVVRAITHEERLGWKILVDRFHYLGYKPLVGEHLMYAAYLEGEVVACIGWASATFRCEVRDEAIGWDQATKKRRLPWVTNQARFLILPWVRVTNLASKIQASNLGQLSRDWQEVWGHGLYLAETFVDSQRFAGTCYRASNWRYVGMSGGRAKQGNRYVHHGRPKAVYLYPLDRHWRTRLSR